MSKNNEWIELESATGVLKTAASTFTTDGNGNASVIEWAKLRDAAIRYAEARAKVINTIEPHLNKENL